MTRAVIAEGTRVGMQQSLRRYVFGATCDCYLILSQSSNDSFPSAMHMKQRLIPAVAALRDAIFVTTSPALIGSECGPWSKHWDYTRTRGTRAISTAAHVPRVIAQASR